MGVSRCGYIIKAGKLDWKIAVLRMRHLNAVNKERQAWEKLADALYERDFLKARMKKECKDE